MFADTATPLDHVSKPPVIGDAEIDAAMRAFFRIVEAWGLTSDQARILLGRPSRGTYFGWKSGRVSRLSHDTLCRISYVLGIWRALQVLFKEAPRADAWIKRPNRALGGQSALDRMLGGDVTDLAAVRVLLDGARGQGA